MDSPTEALIRSNDYPISLPAFEGPLDLLLFLIRKNEIDIYDIPIGEVTRQYLAVLASMEEMKLEIAGDFFVMAATLMYIKSRMLLPKEQQSKDEDEDDEDVDPRWELVQQLIEYKRFKGAAVELEDLIDEAQNRLLREYNERREARDERPLKPSDRIELWNAFNQVLRRLSEKITIGQIHDDAVTVADRMESVLERIRTQKTFLFTDLFEGHASSPAFVIASFLAILELTRLKRLAIVQEANFSDIRCTAVEDEEHESIAPIEIETDYGE